MIISAPQDFTLVHGCSCSFCVLLWQQCRAPAAVRARSPGEQLPGPVRLPGPPLPAAPPPGVPRPQDDAAADLSHAEGDEAGQEARGRRRRLQEARGRVSDPVVVVVARQQVGEEKPGKLSQTQTQHQTCRLTLEPRTTAGAPSVPLT